jgi:hypothetical protein
MLMLAGLRCRLLLRWRLFFFLLRVRWFGLFLRRRRSVLVLRVFVPALLGARRDQRAQ